MPRLRNVRQDQAVKAFIALGDVERPTKKNYRMVTMPNGALLAIPSGVLKVGLLRSLIRMAELTVEEFEHVLSKRGRTYGRVAARTTPTMKATRTYSIAVYAAEPDETGYWAEVLDLPGCVAQGETIDEVRDNVVDAIQAWEETKRELGGDDESRWIMTLNLPVPA